MHNIGVRAIETGYGKKSPGGKIFIGRRKIFADPRAIIATRHIHHILHMYNMIGEALVLSTHKTLFIPSATAKNSASLSQVPLSSQKASECKNQSCNNK